MNEMHSHYYKDVSHLKSVDVYRVLDLFGVTNPCLQHAAKKILCAGLRGNKDYRRDIKEAIDSLNRGLEMMAEDCRKEEAEVHGAIKIVDAAKPTLWACNHGLGINNPSPVRRVAIGSACPVCGRAGPDAE